MDISTTPEWHALQMHRDEMAPVHLRDLFAADPGRADRYTSTIGDLVVDWSKHRITDRTVALLVALATRAGVDERIDAMVAGKPINTTENRAVLHTALRAGPGSVVRIGGVDVMPTVRRELERMAALAGQVRSGTRLGATGRPVTTVVNIGIGGSDLGPRMAYEALAAFRHDRVRCRFVSSVDGSDLVAATTGLDPAETLFIVSSKTFTTVETLTNAGSARAWITSAFGEEAVTDHFVAVTANREAAAGFGIDPTHILSLWDWVGGRYSLGSAIGTPLMIAIGPDRFKEMLAGFRAVDEHLTSRPLAANGPMLLGLVATWNRNFMGFPTRAVIPYARHLHRLPAYLQQLDMESNGKQVHLDGTPVSYETGPVLWGGPGPDSQHSFHQLLHQGTTIAPADFIVFAEPGGDCADRPDLDYHHDLLVANGLAQAEALAFGSADDRADDRLALRLRCDGNRPSTMIMARRLTPAVLGQLIGLYEHAVFTQGAIWGINSFDQPGVELGKSRAGSIAGELVAPEAPALDHDAGTNALIRRYRRLRGRP